MDEITFDLTSLAVADRLKISSLNVNQLIDIINHKATVAEAKAIVEEAGLFVNKASAEAVEEFLVNESEFSEFKAQRNAKRDETISFIVANSKMTKEQLEGMPEDAIESIAASVAPRNKHVMNRSGGPVLELLDDNAPIAQGA